MKISVKRIYEKPSRDDGFRILVDRLWPRGIAKAKAKVDLWLKAIAPSDALRKRFHAKPEKWDAFLKAYFAELKSDTANEAAKELRQAAGHRDKADIAKEKFVIHINSRPEPPLIDDGEHQ